MQLTPHRNSPFSIESSNKSQRPTERRDCSRTLLTARALFRYLKMHDTFLLSPDVLATRMEQHDVMVDKEILISLFDRFSDDLRTFQICFGDLVRTYYYADDILRACAVYIISQNEIMKRYVRRCIEIMWRPPSGAMVKATWRDVEKLNAS